MILSPNTACVYILFIKFDEPDKTFQSVLCPSFLSLALLLLFVYLGRRESVIKVCGLFRSFGSLFFFWLWNETLCLVTPFVSHLGGFYTDTQLIFPILFFFLSNYYSSHFYICITLLLYVGVQIRPKFMVANKIKFMSRFCLT